jgi:hypothetical protein
VAFGRCKRDVFHENSDHDHRKKASKNVRRFWRAAAKMNQYTNVINPLTGLDRQPFRAADLRKAIALVTVPCRRNKFRCLLQRFLRTWR